MDILKTSEAVGIGHPDKVADQISDGVLDLLLELNPSAKVGVETLVSKQLVVLAGEVGSVEIPRAAYIENLVRRIIKNAGYSKEKDPDFNDSSVVVIQQLKRQSYDIASAVNKKDGKVGAGDQGIMVGYACRDTAELLPAPLAIASRIVQLLNAEALCETSPLLTDSKSQVSVRYTDVESSVKSILVACRYRAGAREEIIQSLIKSILFPRLQREFPKYFPSHLDFDLLINSGGPFVEGGPTADTGLTGRKIIADTYGSFAPHGGGAFSGKDPSKVDRSAAYMARYIAKQILRQNPEMYDAVVHIAYAIGCLTPFSVSIMTDGTTWERHQVEKFLKDYNLSPSAIIEFLQLRKIKYQKIARYCHFIDQSLPWEVENVIY